MTTIAFFDIPYHSRLVTTLPLVQALVARGHRVHAFTLPPFEALVASAGAQVELQPPFGDRPPDCTVNLRAIDYSLDVVPALVARLQALRPELVLFTAKCLWSAIAAERCGLPTAVVHTNALWPRGTPVSEAVYAARWPGKSDTDLRQIEDRDRAAWERCAARFRVQRVHPQDVLPGLPNCMNLRGDLNLVYASEALQPRREVFDRSFHFVGPCYDDRSTDADSEFEAALQSLPQPLIYGSLGSMRHYNDRQDLFQVVLGALRDWERDARPALVLSVGAADGVAALGPQPPHVLVRPYLPQLAVLRRASLFLTHAGSNSVYESLLHGVPMLMLPQGGDQPIMAEQVAALGAGRWLRETDLDAAALRAHAEALLADPAAAARARALGDGLRDAGGTPRAVALLEDFAQGAGI